MTVNSLDNTQDFLSFGTAGEEFAVTYKYFQAADLRVYVTDQVTGAATEKFINTDWTATPGSDTGGTVTAVGTIANAGDTVTVTRWVDLLQPEDLPAAGSLPSETVETGLDRAVMMIQALAQRMGGTAFTLELLGLMHRLATDPTKWDGEDLELVDLASPQASSSAATKGYVDAIVISAGNLPPPADPGDDGKGLVASGGSATWQHSLVPTGGVEGEVLRMVPAGTGPDGRDWDWVVPEERNFILNGAMRFFQRGTPITAASVYPNDDDAYTLDRWNLLAEVNDCVDVSAESIIVPTNAGRSLKAEVQAAGAGSKFGFAQYVLNSDTQYLRDKAVSISFEARTTGLAIENLRCALLSWDSSVDVVTSDVVSAWNAEGADPTLVSNWAYVNTPSNLGLTNAFQTFKIENITVPSGANNLAVLIWVDDKDTVATDELYIGNVKLQVGSIATPFQERLYLDELALVEQFFQKTYNIQTAPGSPTDVGQYRWVLVEALGPSAQYANLNPRYARRIRTTPTIRAFSPNDGTEGVMRNVTAGADRAVNILNVSMAGFEVQHATGTSSQFDRVSMHYTADAEL